MSAHMMNTLQLAYPHLRLWSEEIIRLDAHYFVVTMPSGFLRAARRLSAIKAATATPDAHERSDYLPLLLSTKKGIETFEDRYNTRAPRCYHVT